MPLHARPHPRHGAPPPWLAVFRLLGELERQGTRSRRWEASIPSPLQAPGRPPRPLTVSSSTLPDAGHRPAYPESSLRPRVPPPPCESDDGVPPVCTPSLVAVAHPCTHRDPAAAAEPALPGRWRRPPCMLDLGSMEASHGGGARWGLWAKVGAVGNAKRCPRQARRWPASVGHRPQIHRARAVAMVVFAASRTARSPCESRARPPASGRAACCVCRQARTVTRTHFV